jgi:carbon-monoxide dehydrogenase small subunit
MGGRAVKKEIDVKVNGSSVSLAVEPGRTLLQVLREDLGLTGTKEGCGTGECGACTVLVDNEPVRSCLLLAVDANGREVTTIEGLSRDGQPHRVQQAFVDVGAVQCGFCTPGMVLVTKALLDTKPHPTEAEIREAISGNLCRCTGYAKIVKAVQACG